MKYVPANLSFKLARQALKFKKNSPALMFGLGVTGAVVSTVLACKATLKFDELLTEVEEDKRAMVHKNDTDSERYSDKDLAHDLKLMRVQTGVKIARLYAPAVGVGLLSVGLLTGSHVTLTRRNAAITAAYAVLDRGFNEYRDRVRQELGEEKELEFRFGSKTKEIVEEGAYGHEVKTVKHIAANGYSIYARPFDQLNKNWSNHPGDSRTFIMVTQNWFNDKLRANGHVLLNDVYDALGFERTTEGCVVGWVKDGKGTGGDGYIDFGLTDNNPRITHFMTGDENAIWLDFNVDGIVYHKI